MRVQTEEWRRFIPGVRMYKGKMTLFYNGEKLYDNGKLLIYNDWEERLKWEVIIILPGVEVIPEGTFQGCGNVKTVIMNDTVRRIENEAFSDCFFLKFIKLSRNLEYIGVWAFSSCSSLTSIFIPPYCREIRNHAFCGCRKLLMLSVPQYTQLGDGVICGTALIEAYTYDRAFNDEVNEWIKSINDGDENALHRACASSNPPLENDILLIMQRQGLVELRKRNSIGVTPLQYLEANPYADIDEQEILKGILSNC